MGAQQAVSTPAPEVHRPTVPHRPASI